MFEVFVQIMLAITGMCGVYLSQCQPPWARYACLFGMAGEPFWFYTAYQHQQWGIMVLACWYTFAWGKGLYTFWWLPYRHQLVVIDLEPLPCGCLVICTNQREHT